MWCISVKIDGFELASTSGEFIADRSFRYLLSYLSLSSLSNLYKTRCIRSISTQSRYWNMSIYRIRFLQPESKLLLLWVCLSGGFLESCSFLWTGQLFLLKTLVFPYFRDTHKFRGSALRHDCKTPWLTPCSNSLLSGFQNYHHRARLGGCHL